MLRPMRLLLSVLLLALLGCAPPPGSQQLFVINDTGKKLEVRINRAGLSERVDRVAVFDGLDLSRPAVLRVRDESGAEIESVQLDGIVDRNDVVWMVGRLGRRRLVDFQAAYSSRPEGRVGGFDPESLQVFGARDTDAFIAIPRQAVVVTEGSPLPRAAPASVQGDRRAVLRVERLPNGEEDGRKVWAESLNHELGWDRAQR